MSVRYFDRLHATVHADVSTPRGRARCARTSRTTWSMLMTVGLFAGAGLGCTPEAGPGGGGSGTAGLCTNTCRYAYDGDCDDGGPNADYSLCALGTDCADCGVRYSSGSGSGSGSSGSSDGGTGGGGSTSECTFNSSCPSRHVCRSGRCVRVECTSSSHCGSCSRCSDNVCRACGSGPYGCYC